MTQPEKKKVCITSKHNCPPQESPAGILKEEVFGADLAVWTHSSPPILWFLSPRNNLHSLRSFSQNYFMIIHYLHITSGLGERLKLCHSKFYIHDESTATHYTSVDWNSHLYTCDGQMIRTESLHTENICDEISPASAAHACSWSAWSYSPHLEPQQSRST
jgi:hypothetical protein